MSKKTYRVRNWNKYNQALVERGSLTIWLSEEILKSWHETKKTGRRGRPQKYSDITIRCGLTLKALFHLPFRATKGLMKSVVELLGVNVSIPDYTLLCKRQNQLKMNLDLPKRELGESLHLLVDTTGLTVYGEGEWKVRQHGWTKHRLWRKLHVAFNEKTQEIESIQLTDLGTQDCEGMPGLLERVASPIVSVIGDGAYDRFSGYEEAHRRGFELITPPQRNAATSTERSENKKKASLEAVKKRDQAIEQIRELGRPDWKTTVGYHRRSLAETGMFRIKRLLGTRLSTRKFENQQVEAAIWCRIINKMTALGMPISVAVN
jgi:IS5 family transposase